MRVYLLLSIFVTNALLGSDDLKDILKRSEAILENVRSDELVVDRGCAREDTASSEERPKVLNFLSFSVPDSIWLSYDKELSKLEGVFVVRGFPNNSVEEFVQEVRRLKKAGLSSPISIDPAAFQKYGVKSVPEIVIDDGKSFDKMRGSSTLFYAVSKFSREGKTASISNQYEAILKEVP